MSNTKLTQITVTKDAVEYGSLEAPLVWQANGELKNYSYIFDDSQKITFTSGYILEFDLKFII